MLPPHVFADVVGWLHFYDFDALLLADARCSEVARVAASTIRVFDFSDYEFVVYSVDVHIHKLTDESLTLLKFRDATDLVDFIAVAMRNCVFGNLLLWNKACCDAMRDVARTVVVKDTLYFHAAAFVNSHALVEFVTSFKSVKSVRIVPGGRDDSQADELGNLFDPHGFVQDAETCALFFVRRSA